MLNLTIDGTSKSVPTTGFANFKALYDLISNELVREKRVIVEIQINGELMTEGRQFELFNTGFDQIHSVEIVTKSRAEILQEHVEGMVDHLDNLGQNISISSEKFRVGDELQSQRYFAAVLEGIRWFNYAVELFASFLRLDLSTAAANEVTIKSKIEEFNPVLNSLAESQEQEDWVMLADQLEYELLPLVESWKNYLRALKEQHGD